ncbi:uncharacterized protein LOC113367250 [Ctenocephalides felis]|uniref:uncharacterized protein LOC113367250 n=1 Tax=Ctenocephalides felis TaxID=7515 RepID=UPI000E6E32A7|nr:uncharacterized protein LOC113367250 [Ctenocephalides felis]
MVVLTRQKWFPKPFTVDIGETTLTSTRALRYLGVMIDEKLSFREHLDNACIKASKTRYGRISSSKKTYRRKIASVQRRGALRVTCAYRTVSEAAVLVIAGAIPIDLLAFERVKLYDAKLGGDNSRETRSRIKNETLQEWQNRWTSGETGRWTARV